MQARGFSNASQESLAHHSRALARSARLAALELLHRGGGGHYGGVLSVIDLLAALYTTAPIGRVGGMGDALILSKGHAAAALYAILAELGCLGRELADYGALGGLEGHPDMTSCRAIHFSTGSLGQGLGVGVGLALSHPQKDHVWVVLGDGECQEGQIWEAAMLASRYELGGLHVIVDLNGAQECGWQAPGIERAPLPAAAAKWAAFGWQVTELPGHHHCALVDWVESARSPRAMPSVAIAHTQKGHGVSLFADHPERAHHTQLSDSEYSRAREELGAW